MHTRAAKALFDVIMHIKVYSKDRILLVKDGFSHVQV